jgi:hypothetical protein
MSEFINTIDSLGDELTLGKLIEGSLTEVKDDILTKVKKYLFYGATNLSSVDFPNLKETGGYAFQGCTNLTSANLPSLETLGSNSFNGCSKLTSVNLPNVITVEKNAFQGCSTLETVNLPNATAIASHAFYDCKGLTSAVLPNATSVQPNVFIRCSNLTSVSCPCATSVGDTSFYGCSNLTNVDLPLVTTIWSSAFQSCSSLKLLNLPNVTRFVNDVFKSCSSLETLILRASTVCTLSNANSFTNTPIASGTGYIYVPRALIDTYKSATNWSTYAAQFRVLEDYTVDGTTTGEWVEKYKVRFMQGDTVLQESLVPAGQMPVYNGEEPTHTDENYVFIGWKPIIGTVTGDIDYVANFRDNSSQARKLLDGSATEIIYEPSTVISRYTFAYTEATTIDLYNARRIEQYAFIGSKKLSTLIIRSNTACSLAGTNAFNQTLISNNAGYIYVPSALVDEYKVSTHWSALASRIRAIEDYPEITGGGN